MAQDLTGFVEEVKEKVDMIEVIESLSSMKFDKTRRGRYVHATKPDSFMVDPDWGIYTFFANSGTDGHTWETGDIFHWLKRYAGKEFTEACEYLSEKTGVRMPERKWADPEAAKRHKDRLEIYELATAWFERELWKTPAALDYCRRRGLTDETIKRARLGLANKEHMQDLRGDFSMNNVNMDDRAAVAILGKRGGIALWAEQNKIVNASWVENDYIPALGYGTRIVFPHVWRGRVNYFSTRELEWREDKLFSRPDRDAEGNKQPKNFNLPASLVGERQRYYCYSFSRGAKICLVVEGQFDALSAAQLNVASVALVGVAPDAQMAAVMKKNKVERVVLGLDNDKAGKENALTAAAVFGPMTRTVQWQVDPVEDDEHDLDAPENNEELDGNDIQE
ncbi:MAG TPA: hypothetical protein DCG54_07490 [Anaerolineae bacterium]|jgi:DNA primase|nr:hypothetical protein [Anaerolineae bacterium]